MRAVLDGLGRASHVDARHVDRQGLLKRGVRGAQLGLLGTLLLIGGATTQGQTQTLAALPDASVAIDRGGAAKPVSAWTDFCNRYPAECAVDTKEPTTLTMTPALWRTLTAVNRRVNGRIRPMIDQDHWGVVDRWDFPDDGMGDCEDYQLLKRRMLVERGLARRALRMTVVIDEIGEGHAVLTARTAQGDFVLDNLDNDVMLWTKTPYRFLKRQASFNTGRWVTIENGDEVLVGSVGN